LEEGHRRRTVWGVRTTGKISTHVEKAEQRIDHSADAGSRKARQARFRGVQTLMPPAKRGF